MRISTHTDGDVFVIGLQGKIMGDPETTELLDTVKDAMYANHRKVVLDLAGVDWMNSSGMGTLIAAQGLLREMASEMKLASLNDSVKSVLTLNKLNLVFDIHPTVQDATHSFKK
jgi:anti-sigma B factor antagonist